MKRTYIDWEIWHLGGRKKQKVGFLPTLALVARPLLVSAADAVGGEIFKGLVSKIFGGGKKRRRRTVRYA